MLAHLRESLLSLQQRDLAVRAELAADGSLHNGYHPRMEAVHRENADALRRLIAEHGWPHEQLVGAEGAEAAWLIAQHSTGEPDFMRRCRDLLANELSAGRVPHWQYAYLEDRINVCEGRPQRFGTQLEVTPDGPVLCEVAELEGLDERRKQAGLAPLQQHLQAMASEPRPTVPEFEAHKAAEAAWRRQVGWSTAGGA